MYIGLGLFFLALGAILTWAVEFDIGGIEINTIGIILMIVGAVAIVASLVVGSRDVAEREVVERDRTV